MGSCTDGPRQRRALASAAAASSGEFNSGEEAVPDLRNPRLSPAAQASTHPPELRE
jgi:hypothetical protein